MQSLPLPFRPDQTAVDQHPRQGAGEEGVDLFLAAPDFGCSQQGKVRHL